MKSYCLELVSQKSGYGTKLNTMREYLQAYILRIMMQERVFQTTAFIGGTALRFIYNIPRFSEDLDFSLVGSTEVQLPTLASRIKDQLTAAGYKVTVTYNDQRTVQHAYFKFEELLSEVGLSPINRQKFNIKLEIDTQPPEGASTEVRISNIYFPIRFLTYELSSLFAGKIHAILNRGFSKGRDFYDLAWYLSKFNGIIPNFILLNNACKQTGWTGPTFEIDNWREALINVVKSENWKIIKADVVKFLENPQDMEVYTREGVIELLDNNFR